MPTLAYIYTILICQGWQTVRSILKCCSSILKCCKLSPKTGIYKYYTYMLALGDSSQHLKCYCSILKCCELSDNPRIYIHYTYMPGLADSLHHFRMLPQHFKMLRTVCQPWHIYILYLYARVGREFAAF